MRIVTGDVLVSYWPIFFPSLVTVAEVFGKINLTQFKLLLVFSGRGRVGGGGGSWIYPMAIHKSLRAPMFTKCNKLVIEVL